MGSASAIAAGATGCLEFRSAVPRIHRQPDPPVRAAGPADRDAASRLHRAAAARFADRARRPSGLSGRARRAERARNRGVRLARDPDPDRLFPLPHRTLRGRPYPVVAVADRTRLRGRLQDRRDFVLCRDLAGGGAAGSGTFGVAPGGCGGLDLRAAGGGSAPGDAQFRPDADALPAAAPIRPCWRRSASSRPASMPPDLRSARNRSRAQASGCSMRRRTAIACWRAT